MRYILVVCLFAALACRAELQGVEVATTTAAANRFITMHRGASTALEVVVDRPRFAGVVKVAISQLPHGVTTDHACVNVGADTASFLLGASESADLVLDHAIAIVFEDPAGREATQFFRLTVTE